MSPHVFGLDLANIRFSAFKSSNMFDKRYHLRPIRFVWYQLAMIVTVVAECVATYSMSKYLDMQTNTEKFFPGSSYYNNDIVAAGALTIFAGVLTAIVFGCFFFFLLFWPESPETMFWSLVKKISAISCSVLVLAAAILSTIIGTTHSAYIKNADPATQEAILARGGPPLKYSHWPHVIAWIVLIWLGWIFTTIGTVYVFIASKYYLGRKSSPDGSLAEVNGERGGTEMGRKREGGF
ncbi:hypothetical protein JAAARDRAFT_211425 [Jaapia argillacea MUCL 33604]|uniref:MARVEL domain-containing protein n=1 Tax=Jaapia argillacea MUCL 33604 TaxID=933084 RepID=A0A067P8C2_9AGAM|nr:hypothetical protein JAAARDRAFT_211425 [Jaapia argillacea MUCL 33604]